MKDYSKIQDTTLTQSISRFISILSVSLSAIGAIILSVESYLSQQGTSLCKTDACQLVSNFITIPESTLITLGAVFFWTISGLLFFEARYPRYLGGIPILVLFLGLAFDGTLIGFQYFTIQQKCLICLLVAGLLITTSLMHCIAKKKFILALCCLIIWGGGFGANSIIKMPLPSGAIFDMSFYTADYPQNGQHSNMTLILSMDCPHCMEVISYLAENPPIVSRFNIATIDLNEKSLAKVSSFLNTLEQAQNIFSSLKEAKEFTPPSEIVIDNDLSVQANNARIFLSNLGISKIPVLLSEEDNQEKVLNIGAPSIISFLESINEKIH